MYFSFLNKNKLAARHTEALSQFRIKIFYRRIESCSNKCSDPHTERLCAAKLCESILTHTKAKTPL